MAEVEQDIAMGEVRISGRTTKGIPPLRYQDRVQGLASTSNNNPKASRAKRTSMHSKATSAGRKSEMEAERDEKLAQRQRDYADKKKRSQILAIRVNSTARRLEAAVKKNDSTPNPTSQKLIDQLQEDLGQFEDEKAILDAELEEIELTQKTEIQAINSRFQADMDALDSDDGSSIHLENEDSDVRTEKWAAAQQEEPDEDSQGKYVPPVFLKAPDPDETNMQVYHLSYANPAPKAPMSRPVDFTERQARHSPKGPAERLFNVGEDIEDTEENEEIDRMAAVFGRAMGQALGGSRFHSGGGGRGAVDYALPKFSGNPGDWEHFRTEYARTSSRYENSENLCRLRLSLSGDALAAVKHLMANPNNLKKLMEMLGKRFGRPEFVLEYLIEKAKATRAPDQSKPETLIEFGTAIDALVTNIVSFNEKEYLYNRQLVNEFVGKLPTTLRTQWHEWLLDNSKRKPHLNFFSQWLTRKVDAAIMAVKPKVVSEIKDEERKRGRNRAHGFVNVVAVDKDTDTCPCCGKTNHTIDKCWKFQKITTNERWQIMKDNELCLCCLKRGHKSRKCPKAAKCPKEGCSHYHHVLLHSDMPKNIKQDVTETPEAAATPIPSAPTADGMYMAAIIEGTDGPLQIVPVKIRKADGSGYIKVHAFLDGGATCSMMLKTLADKLGLEGEPIGSYQYSGINGESTTVHEAVKMKCEVAGVGGGAKYHTCYGVMTVDSIPLRPYSFNAEEAVKKWPHLRHLQGKSVVKVVPQLIIGNNNTVVYPRKIISGNEGEPCAVKTVFGWTAGGNFGGGGSSNINIAVGTALDDQLHHLVKRSFTIDDFGVKLLQSKGSNLEEKRGWKILEETSKKVNGCWEVGLLWRDDKVSFPDGECEAFTRLQYTERKMKDPIFKQKYLDKIAEYLQKGYLRKLTCQEATSRPPHTRYIPHFGQINPNKPDKFRFIMDAKAKSGGTALNDKLLKGPDLIRPLTAVLWNFRIHKIALTGDIADMFHRIRIRQEDQCSQRILWRDGDISRPPDHYQMEVLIFGATSSPAAAIYIKNRNADDWKELYPRAAAVVTSDYYVDDMLTGGDTVEEVIQLRNQMTQIMEAGNFRVCKYLSNSPEVLASIPNDLKSTGAKGLEDKEEFSGERVLGLWWDPSPTEDNFRFKLTMHKVKKSILDGEIPTKRQMCGVIMSLYDPLGFISQFKIKGLMMLQEVWRVGTGWDDEIPESIHQQWQWWLKKMTEIANVRVPRCYSSLLHEADEIQMHVFQDASEQSFSCVCYLRIRKGNEVHVVLVGSKARVAPLKKLTIPQLELLAALLGCRLAKTLCEELRVKISSRWFWSDSRTVLYWLRSTGVRYKEFVANRVGEIQEDTDASEWHWVPTKLNVADQATRFESEISFDPESEWYSGPAFLKLDPSEFPKEEKQEQSQVSVVYSESVDVGYEVMPIRTESRESTIVPDPQRFSKYHRLLRATAATIKIAEYWLKKDKRNGPSPFTPSLQSTVDAVDLKKAELLLLRLLQHEAFPEEVLCLKEKRPVNKKSSIWRLGPIMDADSIIRLDGRIGRADVEEDVKFPIILSAKHYITDLIIDEEHINCHHQGVDTVLCNLRQKFWIVEGRKAVQRSWSRCQMCKLKNVKPIPPRMASLPYFRLASNFPPFSHCGLDFFGPMEVTVGRRHEKRWGALFCCQVTRAVHLEVCHGLTTDEVMLALSRFVDARGRPHRIFSDNGTNFVGASRELKEAAKDIDIMEIKGYGKFTNIQWSFNPAGAPHMGGSWERLVQSVKKCLHATLHGKYPKDTTLLTALKSCENVVNSRPLTHASFDPADPQPITPNHFLRGHVDFGPGIPSNVDANDEFLRVHWKRAQQMANQFWVRWTREYLPKLLRRDKWHVNVDPIQVGELVFIVDERQPRNCWIRGYISAVFPGQDGQVRVAEVTTRDFVTRKATTYRRPVTKLCPLGLKMEIPGPADPKFGAGNDVGPNHPNIKSI